jgi:hypothetical protein
VRLQTYLQEDVVEDEVNLKKHAIFMHKGVKLMDTHHAYVRIQQRNELTNAELKTLFTEAIEKFLVLKKRHIGMHFVFHSKKLKQAFIASMDADKKLTMITYYPRGQVPNKDTHPFQHDIVLEGV